MPARRTLEVTEAQREELIEHRDHDPRPWVRERCAALLKIADGMTPPAVARRGLLKPRDPATVYAWLNWYETHGFWSVEHFPQGGRHRGAPIARRAELEERLAHAPGEEARQEIAPTADGPPPSRWSVRAVRATFRWTREMSLAGVWRALRREGLCLRRGRIRPYSPDPAYATKRDHLLACLRDAATHPDEVALLFLDEMGFYRWPEPAADGGSAAPAAAPVAARGGPNNKQWRIMGALHALTGQVTYRDAYISGREKVGAFYHQLVTAYPQARRIYVVQDNWSIHTHPDVCAVLDSLPHITPVWLPTYAPWLNPIEPRPNQCRSSPAQRQEYWAYHGSTFGSPPRWPYLSGRTALQPARRAALGDRAARWQPAIYPRLLVYAAHVVPGEPAWGGNRDDRHILIRPPLLTAQPERVA